MLSLSQQSGFTACLRISPLSSQDEAQSVFLWLQLLTICHNVMQMVTPRCSFTYDPQREVLTVNIITAVMPKHIAVTIFTMRMSAAPLLLVHIENVPALP